VYLEEREQCLVKFEPEVDVDEVLRQFDLLTQKWDVDLLPEIDPIGVEERIEMDIAGRKFLMFIDLIQQTERGKQVLDWKVTKKAKGQANTQASLQLSIYAHATQIHNVAFGSLIRATEGKENSWKPRVDIHHATRTSKDLDWAMDVLASTIEGIEAEYFPVCSPENFLCSEKYCDFWDMCRGKKTKIDVKVPSWFGE
jgi:hypothetical protein